MHLHPNARLTALGKERLVRRHIDEHVPLAELPCQSGISLRTHYKWLARFRSGGPAAPLSTTGRWFQSMGLGRPKNLQPNEPVRRYQWAQPGDIIHVDT